MPINLVPIKIEIGRKATPRGGATNDYPDFNNISLAIRRGLDWAAYVDTHGSRMLYGKILEGNSQFCVMCVPEDFALAALAMFPTQVTEMNETDLEIWYDTNAASEFLDENRDVDVMQAIKTRRDLGIADTQDEIDALNPQNPKPGIRENPLKNWVRLKAKRNLGIIARLQKP